MYNPVYMSQDFSVFIPSSRPLLQIDAAKSLRLMGIKSILKNGQGYPSFAQLINHCVVESPTEIVIICNDKARPNKDHIDKTIRLINEGYGFVGLYCFGFFGFKKELFRRVGFLDERYVGGNYEDCDFIRRLNEADVAGYFSYEIPYLEFIPSAWSKGLSYIHYVEKWADCSEDNLTCYRKLAEIDLSEKYDLGPSVPAEFLPWSESYIEVGDWFKKVKIITDLK